MIKSGKIRGIGMDIAEHRRFNKNAKSVFFKKFFTEREKKHCLSFKDGASRLAGHFAAKEAVVKAYGGKVFIGKIEIRHSAKGVPEVWIDNKKDKKILISISHARGFSCAMAVLI